MSETRMTDEEFEQMVQSCYVRGNPSGTLAEARRARAAESTLAAQLAASQAECERARGERDALAAALEHERSEHAEAERELNEAWKERGAAREALTYAHEWMISLGHYCDGIEPDCLVRAALSPPAPKGEEGR